MWKETVVQVGRHTESVYCPSCGEEFGIEDKVEYEREFQAEITGDIAFEIGRAKGYQEGLLARDNNSIKEFDSPEQKQVSKLDALDAVSGMLNELTPEQRETFNTAIKPIATCPTCGQDRRNSPTASCVYEHFCG